MAETQKATPRIFTAEELIRYLLANGKSFNGLAHMLLTPNQIDRFNEAVASAEKTYYEAVASAEKTYYEAVASAEKTYYEAVASAEKTYDEAVAPAKKTRDEAFASAEKTYDEATISALIEILNLQSEPTDNSTDSSSS